MSDQQSTGNPSSSAAADTDMNVDTTANNNNNTNAFHQQFQQQLIAKSKIQKPQQHYVSMHSDSNYTAVARYTRRPFAKTATMPHVLLNNTIFNAAEDDLTWAADYLSDDDVDTDRPEAAVAPLLEEGELDADAIVVSPTGNSAMAANNVAERRRREEGWNDLGLDQIDSSGNGVISGHSRQLDSTT